MQEKVDERKGGTSASNAQADLLCQGRHLAQRDLPEIESDDAKFGTQIHAALAKNSPAGLSQEQILIYDGCLEIEQDLIRQVFGEQPKIKTFREQRFWVQVKDEKDDQVRYLHSGRVDVVHRSGPTLLIVEYKSLAGDQPDAPTNLQLRDQAVLAARNLVATEVFTAVDQPLVTHKPALCRYDGPTLEQAEKDMFERVRNSNNPSGRTAGQVQCAFCRAKESCAEYALWSSTLVPAQIRTPLDVAMAQWSLEQRSTVAANLPVLEKLLSEAKQFLKDCLTKDPESVPGFYLKPGAIRTPIVDAEALFSRFVELGGTLDQFMACVKITKKEFESAVRQATGKKGKALAAELDKLTDGITEEKQNAPSLAKKD